ncbi:plasmid pRiA4b ORF-3 family protein [Algoriphagus sp. AGSA1]|uniref:plasmid pRiA4b ORF-3 family protein n=1 Tax=Algoriphagus sp. AGSA1 TaxID=2907213 RepID=UPI001F3837B0|nr:plasmid pRiA4b ORF-3 family protein [Algoriphagus sp. AGSA1]MCE7057711.1 plasmid pRiA4b ORF-3 family protein [Algoriphagus sp. AGSA1]
MLLQLKIQIKGISNPPVWRRILVPGHFTFSRLHNVIQASFGWEDYHLYQFSPKGYGSEPQIGEEDEWSEEDMENAEEVKIEKYLNQKGQKFTYIYDLGDDWIHTLTVEEIREEKAIRAELLSGKGACPPEDCGGIWGYESLKETLADPKHEMHDEMLEWLGLEKGEDWDTLFFDMEYSKATVATV